MDLFSVTNSDIFVSSFQMQQKLESLSNQALQRGIDLHIKKDYSGAATEFQRSISINPSSDYTVSTTQYLAQSYLKLEQTDKAIDAYQTALKRHNQSDQLYVELGKILFLEDRFDEAAKAYKSAVAITPSANNQFSLGKALLRVGQFGEAKAAFNSVIRMDPRSSDAHIGLGQVLSKEGKYKDAIKQFETAISKQRDNYDAHLEIGYAYADMGDIKKAKKTADFLVGKDDKLESLLRSYIIKSEPPRMRLGLVSSTFSYNKSFKTPVSALDAYLEQADACKSFNLKIVFDKEMDRKSVENILNWNISRALSPNLAKTYNFGDVLPDTEVLLNSIPNYVLYDSEAQTATIGFTIQQNSTANGTIDPSHIVFSFSGKDIDGNKIDPNFDEFSGFSKIT